MNIEELQTALDHVLTLEEVAVLTYESRIAMATAWEAVTVVANPNIEAAEDYAHNVAPALVRFVSGIVAAALTPQGDTK